MTLPNQDGNETGETLEQTLERRYLSRFISYREAKKNRKSADQKAQHLAAGQFKDDAAGHNAACAEIHKLARDRGISLDIENISQKAHAFEQEAEAVALAFKEDL
jgi:hypothetical protein